MKLDSTYCGALLLLAAATAQSATPISALPVFSTGPGALPPAATTSKPGPLRYAVAQTLAVTQAEQGLWEHSSDGNWTWRMAVHSSNANSLSFAFRQFHLPAGGVLYVYDLQHQHVQGPYGAEHNIAGELWTALVPGADAVIEADLPAADKDEFTLQLAQVNHGFLEFWKAGATAKSGSCNVDVACPDGDAWRNEIRSVARYTIGGQYLCSGQLVNNTRRDFTPYFLTAAHCLSTQADAQSTVYYWNYQTTTCGGAADGRLDQNQSGASLTATYAPSDFTLLQLSATPSSAYNVYYAGWETADAAPSDGVACIHHPGGDEKRISLSNHPTHVTTYGGAGSSGDGTHLQVERWDSGTTEGGSSGSGLWNQAHHLVGQLHGGNASCSDTTASDWFGRFAVSWTGGGTAADSLQPNLDSLKSSTTVLDGADPAGKTTSFASSAAAPAAGSARFGGSFSWLGLVPLLLGGLRRSRGAGAMNL